jgi:hypothetical protein
MKALVTEFRTWVVTDKTGGCGKYSELVFGPTNGKIA